MSRPVRAADTRVRRRRVSLRRRLAAAFVATGLVFVAGGAVVGWSYAQQVQARDTVVNVLDPSGFQLHNFMIGLVNQETGVRGYAITGETRFLEPYESGVIQQTDSSRLLRSRLARGSAPGARLAELESAAKAWQAASGDALIRAVRNAGPGAVTAADLSRSKARFDTVRSKYTATLTALAATRAAAIDRTNTSTQRVMLALGALALALVICALLLWYGLRRLVLEPIERLAGSTRVVTAGDTGAAIRPEGPAEIVELATDVEAMRARIVEDLAIVELARDRIERQAADLERSNAELEQFAYVASHDLQEPLRKVASFCQLLEQRYADDIDDRGKQYIGFAVDGAKRMQALILDLLAFSRVGRTTERMVPVPLERTAARAQANLGGAIEASHARVTVGPLPTVEGDETLLIALFQNLIGNAIKFNASGTPTVRIESRTTDAGWEITCADNGIGIEPEYGDRVFAIFQRLHGREEYDGTGIGLALCRKIVEYHGGRIWVDAAAVEGATIRFTLPLHAPISDAEFFAAPGPEAGPALAAAEPAASPPEIASAAVPSAVPEGAT